MSDTLQSAALAAWKALYLVVEQLDPMNRHRLFAEQELHYLEYEMDAMTAKARAQWERAHRAERAKREVAHG